MSAYDVGGLRYERPFKIRRLGHSGFNVSDLDLASEFYVTFLGLNKTEELDLRSIPALPPDWRSIEDPRIIFTAYGSDHHAVVLAHKSFDVAGDADRSQGITLNQITWQVSTLEEVVNAEKYLRSKGVSVSRVGRDMPGSNWHIYFKGPDGHTNELYYGIEQIGWLRKSKPPQMYYRSFLEPPALPQISERQELADAEARGIDLHSGYREALRPEYRHSVGGVLLAHPFKIIRLGPIGLFVPDVEQSAVFYANVLGLTLTEELKYQGERCLFLRSGSEHHSLALYPLSLRERLGFSSHSRCMSFGFQLGSYSQLRACVEFLKQRGCRFLDVPAELYPGMDYVAHVLDPDGQCVQLYYYMEQVGWDGRPKPTALRRTVGKIWPDQLEPLSDSYADMPFLGPLD